MGARDSEGGDRRALSIPARLERLAEVREFVDHAASAAGFAEAERYEVKLALNEAVTNAIRHGSESPDDRVEILVSEHDGQLDLSVADSGVFVHRFELRRQLAEGGRGLAFIAELMDGLEVCPEYEGTTIRFSKRSASP
ncbi:MAG TPA: ATP-binding protein [Thermoleophilaceae bacterium]|nr:ATP-binding protein [Thermoleophilaceae bacterium]